MFCLKTLDIMSENSENSENSEKLRICPFQTEKNLQIRLYSQLSACCQAESIWFIFHLVAMQTKLKYIK